MPPVTIKPAGRASGTMADGENAVEGYLDEADPPAILSWSLTDLEAITVEATIPGSNLRPSSSQSSAARLASVSLTNSKIPISASSPKIGSSFGWSPSAYFLSFLVDQSRSISPCTDLNISDVYSSRTRSINLNRCRPPVTKDHVCCCFQSPIQSSL